MDVNKIFSKRKKTYEIKKNEMLFVRIKKSTLPNKLL